MENERDSLLWDQACDWAYQRASEEGDVDLDYDDDLIGKWAEEYYSFLISKRNE